MQPDPEPLGRVGQTPHQPRRVDQAQGSTSDAWKSIAEQAEKAYNQAIVDARAEAGKIVAEAKAVVIGYLTIQAMLYGDFLKDAIYVDATKDRMYCDAKNSVRRRASQTAMYDVFTALAKLMPARSLSRTCRTSGIWYSTGSSTVMILRSLSFKALSVAYRVVVLPLPVGPVTRNMPLGRSMARWMAART